MNKEDKTKSLPQKEERKPQGAPASGGMEQDLPQLLAELQVLRQRERDWVFREDLEKLRKAFPDMAPESIPQLGDDFLKLRSMGIDPLIAFLAIRQAERGHAAGDAPHHGPRRRPERRGGRVFRPGRGAPHDPRAGGAESEKNRKKPAPLVTCERRNEPL